MLIDKDLNYTLPSFNPLGKFGSSLSGGKASAIMLTDLSVFSISAWVKILGSNLWQIAVSTNNPISNNAIHLGIYGDNTAFAAYGSTVFNTSTIIGDNSWHLLTLTMDLSGGKFFVDGVLTSTSAETHALNTLIGIRFPIGFVGYEWHGEVDEVVIYNTAKYTSNFTPPLLETVASSDISALFHLLAVPSILANNINIIYSPYNWKLVGNIAKTINAGAYFRCLFSGTILHLVFNLDNIIVPFPQIWYRIDGYGEWILSEVKNDLAVTIPVNTILWEKHILEVVVKSTAYINDRWLTQSTAVLFEGLILDVGCNLYPTIELDDNILVYGDSITEGLRTVLLDAIGNNLLANDSKLSYSFELAKLLGCEFGIVGFGAQGFNVLGQGNVPKFFDSFEYLWDGELRDFSKNPKYVIINMGTNDGANNVTNEITTFLNGILNKTLGLTKIIMICPFGGYQSNNIQTAINECSNPARCVFIDTSGFFNPLDSLDGYHPLGYTRMNIVPLLVNKIKIELGNEINNEKSFVWQS